MDSVLCKEAGERICTARKRKCYTREMLAQKSGISSKFLYEIEQGKKRFSADVLCRIAEALSVSCDYIMFGNAEKVTFEKDLVETISHFDRKQQQKLVALLKLVYEVIN